jgi:hypothetical protein
MVLWFFFVNNNRRRKVKEWKKNGEKEEEEIYRDSISLIKTTDKWLYPLCCDVCKAVQLFNRWIFKQLSFHAHC